MKPAGTGRAPNLERIAYDELLEEILKLLLLYRGIVRVTILKNIAIVTHALLTLFKGARGGNGWLSKAALAPMYAARDWSQRKGTTPLPSIE
ncbi:MAG: hypothetical protein A2035_08660 [Nitrospirae bacterium GWA2_42_11]|nr:MAG: hypothetical protein A2035_08660 [Nitrospirae bacterium GWA2_42_11]